MGEATTPASTGWGRLAVVARHPAFPRALALAGLTVTLAAAFWLKRPALDGWTGTNSWFAYTDIVKLWPDRGFDRDLIPYVQAGNEYPPVTGAMQYLAALATTTLPGWFHLNVLLLSAFAVGTALLLVSLRPGLRIFVFCLAPSIVLYAFHNWDLLAVFLTTLGLVLFARDRPGWAGAVLALAFYAKFYPLLFLPVLGVELLRRERGLGPAGWRFGLAAVGTLVGFALPFLLFAREGFLLTYLYHAQRGPTTESLWHLVPSAIGPGALAWLDGGARTLLGNGAILLGLAACCLLVIRGRVRWQPACLGALCIFLFVNPVISVQYALWVLPLLVLVGVPPWLLVAFFVTDLLAYFAVFDYLGYSDGPHTLRLALASAARAVVYALLAAYALSRRPMADPPTGSSPGAAESPPRARLPTRLP